MDEKAVYAGVFGNPKLCRDHPYIDSLVPQDPSRPDGFESAEQLQKFEAIRRAYDEALQVAREVPLCPQAGQDTKAYRRSLLERLAPHASFLEQKRLELCGPSSFDAVEKSLIANVLDKPRREGRLEPIVRRDRSGREITEFVGAKSAWLNQFRSVGYRMEALDGVPVEQLGL